MTEPYLILHKVRGEPAFDIATKLLNDDGSEFSTPSDPAPWWIIPTSGARAYPHRVWTLTSLCDVNDEHNMRLLSKAWDRCEWSGATNETILNFVDDDTSLPFYMLDHYTCNDQLRHEVTAKPSPRPRSQPTINDLMELLK